MYQFRKKPVVIEAFRFDGDLIGSDGKPYVPEWAMTAFKNGILFYQSQNDGPPCELFAKTLEGDMHVSVDDYVIQGVSGEIYPCKPNIFEMTYDPVE